MPRKSIDDGSYTGRLRSAANDWLWQRAAIRLRRSGPKTRLLLVVCLEVGAVVVLVVVSWTALFLLSRLLSLFLHQRGGVSSALLAPSLPIPSSLSIGRF